MKSNYKNIDDANKKIDSIIKQFEICQEKTQKENSQLKEQINTSQTSRLIAENNRLNEICIYWEQQYNELKQENKQLKERISKLVSENVRLQNDLFTEQLNEDETDDYIDTLKNELFQIYINKNN